MNNPMLYQNQPQQQIQSQSHNILLALRGANNKYVSAEGNKELYAKKDKPTEFEMLTLFLFGGKLVNDAKIALSVDKGFNVTSAEKKQIKTKAAAVSVGEIFTLVSPTRTYEIKSGNWVALRDWKGKYLSLKKNSYIKADRSEIGPNELFKLEIVNYM